MLTWTHSQLMGKKTAEAVQRILTISESIIAQQNLDPRLFTEIFEGFENFQGVFGQLKGKLFELLMAYFFQRRFSDTLLGWQINDSDIQNQATDEENNKNSGIQEFDVDIAAFQDTEAVIVECKGIKMDGDVEEGEVSKHFTRRLPLARRLLLDEKNRPTRRFKAVLITTGGFDDTTTRKYQDGDYQARPDTTFELWDRVRLLNELRSADQKELISVVDRYYQ